MRGDSHLERIGFSLTDSHNAYVCVGRRNQVIERKQNVSSALVNETQSISCTAYDPPTGSSPNSVTLNSWSWCWLVLVLMMLTLTLICLLIVFGLLVCYCLGINVCLFAYCKWARVWLLTMPTHEHGRCAYQQRVEQGALTTIDTDTFGELRVGRTSLTHTHTQRERERERERIQCNPFIAGS